MRVLVTGAAGFVGGALAARLLRDGHEVTAFVRNGQPPSGCTVIRGDLCDLYSVERALARSRLDAVFHLAAQAIVPYAVSYPWATFEDNVRGTYNLLEAFRRHGSFDTRLVVASSDKAYGELPDYKAAYRESYSMDGRGPYDVSKSCADLLARSYATEFGLRIAVVRCGNTYGPGDTHVTRVVPTLVSQLVRGEPVRMDSDGSPVRDYLYIDDAVDGYLAVERYLAGLPQVIPYGPQYQAFNFAGGVHLSVRDLVDLARTVAREFGLTPGAPAFLGTRRGEIWMQALDCTLARRVLGWEPRVGLADGLRRILGEHLGGPEVQGPLQGDQPGVGIGLGLTGENTPG